MDLAEPFMALVVYPTRRRVTPKTWCGLLVAAARGARGALKRADEPAPYLLVAT